MSSLFSAVNTIWVLLGAALVFFMQAGFAMVETGFTRAKNAGNIIMKNLMDFCIGTPLFWLFGFGIMFGVGSGFIGNLDIASTGDYSHILPAGVPMFAFLIFQTVFCATAATIVSGAMAERTKFSSYCMYSAIISLVIYPISGHWIWGGGWLSQMGFHDFAGSTAVHMVGGVSALIGAKILGPRIGKYNDDGTPRAIPGHSLTLGALGVFILWFCWFGFNGCSTVAMDSDAAIQSASKIFVTTNLAAAVATCTCMAITWIKYKKPDVSMTLNGTLAGLVAITAGCDTVSPLSSAIIGLIAGFAVVYGIEFIDKVLHIDDPVGAVGVHGVCGALGTVLVGFFSDGTATPKGLFLGGGFECLITQLIGVASVIAWVAVTMTAVFLLIKRFHGLRVEPSVEIQGLDVSEHGLVSSYADFMPSTATMFPATSSEIVSGDVSATDASRGADVITVKQDHKDAKFTKVSIVCKQGKFEQLKNALNKIGVTGITVTQVMGCGQQKGAPEYYRGVPIGVTLLPKIQVDVVVAKVPVKRVIDTAKKALYTGHIGDGKIFVYDVENVVRVRTGEEGYVALQGEDA
ncbi:MAG: ammonium transporter [Clostridia bacterium]|nr:ammonium transporter [Clostridia bacterium]